MEIENVPPDYIANAPGAPLLSMYRAAETAYIKNKDVAKQTGSFTHVNDATTAFMLRDACQMELERRIARISIDALHCFIDTGNPFIVTLNP